MPDALRASIAPLLTNRPADALTRYFALEHDPRRSRLFARHGAGGRVTAFVAVCQTGIDLFRPFVVMRGDDSDALRGALREALVPGRQYLFSILPTLQPDVEDVCMLSGVEFNLVYALSPGDFKPVLNLMVSNSRTPDGLLRSVMWAKDNVVAAEAGTSWISTDYAELYVRVEPQVRGRGLGKSVVSAVTQQVLALRRTPLYMTSAANTVSRHLAESLGYLDTGATEISGNMIRRP